MSQPNLTEDLNIVANSNIEITLLDGDLNIIQKLDDEPNDVGGLTAAELKAKFDEAGNIIKAYINGTLIPEILAEDATEEARAAAEESRVTAEAERQSAEEARASAEATRQSNEETRQSNETARVAAENARANAESSRATAESSRASAETGRVNTESDRVSAETERARAEQTRVNSETARVSAENSRAGAEEIRVSNESTRVSAEHGRVSAENARTTAEQAREAAEKARADETTGIVTRATEQADLASSAATYAGNRAAAATNSESAAASSASSAAGSAAAASTSETNAKASETAAKASEEAAKASETAAKTSETTAKSEADRAKSEADRAAGIVGGDYATKADLEKKQDKFVSITIPKGRMRGDVDGDGKVTTDDSELALKLAVGTITLDETAEWCADADADGSLSSSDKLTIEQYLKNIPHSSLTKVPTFADYYNNWVYEKIDEITGKWYTDLFIDGVSASSSVLVVIDPSYTEDIFINSVCGDGYVRIFASRCPIVEVPCIVQISEGNVTGIVIPSPFRPHSSRHSKGGSDPIDAAGIGAAVDGESTNIDTQSVNGIFTTSNSSEGTFPAGISYKLGALIHKEVVPNYYKEQIFIQYENKVYRRTYIAGWGDWKEIYDSGNKPTPSDIGAASPAKFVTVTLAAASWDSTAKTQTVTVTGVKASETAQMITPTPALASQTAYYDAGILCTGQAADSLTFTADTIPTADLTVYVVIQEVTQG